MENYQKLIGSSRNSIVSVYWSISILLIFLDTLVNYTHNPFWMIKLNLLLLSTMTCTLIIIRLQKMNIYPIFIGFTYVFTLYIYLPVFVGNGALRETLLASTTRIAACMIYIPLVALLGARIHALALGGLNVLLVVASVVSSRYLWGYPLSIDPVVVGLFIGISAVSYFLVSSIDKMVAQQAYQLDNEQQQRLSLLNERLIEQTKRSDYNLLKLNEANEVLENVSGKLALLVQENQEKNRD